MQHDARLVCDIGTNTISKSHCGSFWKILISFCTRLGLPVKFGAWTLQVLFLECKMQRCYKYPPTLSEHEVMCTAHGPFFKRLWYTCLASISWIFLCVCVSCVCWRIWNMVVRNACHAPFRSTMMLPG